jgi:hypothetical protein
MYAEVLVHSHGLNNCLLISKHFWMQCAAGDFISQYPGLQGFGLGV